MKKIMRQTKVMEPETIKKNGKSRKSWMNSRNLLLFAILTIITGLFMFNSCSTDKEQEKSLEVSPTSLQFDAGASDYQAVNITSNVSTWDAILSDSWCHLENASTTTMGNEYKLGSGNGMIRIRVDANTTAYSRTSTIEVRDEDYQSLVKDITVYQAAGTGTGGNTGGGAIPTAPTGLTAADWTDINGDFSMIQWDDVPAAESYNIYWSNTVSGTYSLIANVPNYSVSGGGQHSYKHYSTFMDNYYKLTSKNSSGESGYSSVVYCKNPKGSSGSGSGGGTDTPPPAPTGVTAIQSGAQIIVSWNSVSQASSYIVWYMSPMQTFEDFVTAYTNSYTFTWNNPVSGLYSFKVYSTNSSYVNSTSYGSASCNYTTGGGGGGTTTQKLDTPTGLEAATGPLKNFVQISFDIIPLAYTYELYRATSASGTYSKITASGGSNMEYTRYILTDSNPLTGTSYYKVKAIPLSSMTNLTASDLSNYVSITL